MVIMDDYGRAESASQLLIALTVLQWLKWQPTNQSLLNTNRLTELTD